MYYEEQEELVSIIVPVYNISSYIDKCIESLLNQTYKNIEILLLNDGSTDDSAVKCFEWSQKDDRIIFVSKKNEKQGPTMNLGLQMAKGKYVTFVDSDDYVDETYVSKLYAQITALDADMVFCDIVEIVGDKKTFLISNINIHHSTNILETPHLMLSVFLGNCGKIYRKSIYLENEIKMSNYAMQDVEVFPQIFLFSKKVGQVKEALYYYVKDREGNTNDVHSDVQARSFLRVMETVVSSMKKVDAFDKMQDLLKNYLLITYLVAFYGLNPRGQMKQNVAEDLLVKAKNGLGKYFPGWENHLEQYFLCIGNPSVKARVSEVNAYSKYYSNEFVDMYSFSSIISMMSEKNYQKEDKAQLTNSFRKNMIEKDLRKGLMHNLKGKDFIIINLLEERFDLVEYQGGYFTKSGEFDKTDFAQNEEYQILLRDSEIVNKLYEESILKFIHMIKPFYKKEQIIISEEYVFEGMMDYDCSSSVQRMNEILHHYYDYLKNIVQQEL